MFVSDLVAWPQELEIGVLVSPPIPCPPLCCGAGSEKSGAAAGLGASRLGLGLTGSTQCRIWGRKRQTGPVSSEVVAALWSTLQSLGFGVS